MVADEFRLQGTAKTEKFAFRVQGNAWRDFTASQCLSSLHGLQPFDHSMARNSYPRWSSSWRWRQWRAMLICWVSFARCLTMKAMKATQTMLTLTMKSCDRKILYILWLKSEGITINQSIFRILWSSWSSNRNRMWESGQCSSWRAFDLNEHWWFGPLSTNFELRWCSVGCFWWTNWWFTMEYCFLTLLLIEYSVVTCQSFSSANLAYFKAVW